MDKVKLAIIILMMVGLMLAMAGALLLLFFNYQAYTLPIMVRYVGLGISLVLLFIGVHVVSAGLTSLRES